MIALFCKAAEPGSTIQGHKGIRLHGSKKRDSLQLEHHPLK
jgi:hypothetical protein